MDKSIVKNYINLFSNLSPDNINEFDNLISKNIRSSIFENNYMYSERMIIKTTANTDILFDPQTSGPLLATVPKGKVKGVIAAGEKLGFECKLIGELTNGKPYIEVL